MIPNCNKTMALVFSRSRTVNHPHGDLVLFRVSIRASPNIDILGLKFHSKLPFEDHVHGTVSSVSLRIGILRLVKRIFVDTSACVISLLFCICFHNPSALFSGVAGSSRMLPLAS